MYDIPSPPRHFYVILSLTPLMKALHELEVWVHTIVQRGDAEEALEEAAEVALIGETKLIANLLDVAAGVAQKKKGLDSQGSVDG